MVIVRGKRLIHSLVLVMIAVGVVACGGDPYTEGPRPQPEPTIDYRIADNASFYASYQYTDAKGSILDRVVNIKLSEGNVLTRELPIELFYRGGSYKDQTTTSTTIRNRVAVAEYGSAAMAETSYSPDPFDHYTIRVEPRYIDVYENDEISNAVAAKYDFNGLISFRSISSSVPVVPLKSYRMNVGGGNFEQQPDLNFEKQLDLNIVPSASWVPVTTMVVQSSDGGDVSAEKAENATPTTLSISGGVDHDEVLGSGRFRVFYGEDATVTPEVLPPSNPDLIIENTNPRSFNTTLMYVEGEGYFLDIAANRIKQNATIKLTTVEKHKNGTPIVSQVLRINTHYGLFYPQPVQYLPAGTVLGGDVSFTFMSRNLPRGAVVKIEEVVEEGADPLLTIEPFANIGVRSEASDGDGATYDFTVKAAAELAEGDSTTLKASAYFADGTTPLNGADGKPLTSSVDVVALAVGMEQGDDPLAAALPSCGFDAYPVVIITGYKKEFTTESIVDSVSGVALEGEGGNVYDTVVKRVDLDGDNKVTAVDTAITSSGALVCLQDSVEAGKKLPTAGEEVSGTLSVGASPQTVGAITITPTLNVVVADPQPAGAGEVVVIPIHLGAEYTANNYGLRLDAKQDGTTDDNNILNITAEGMPYLAFGGDISKKSQASRTGPLVVTMNDALPATAATATIPVYVTNKYGGDIADAVATKMVTITSKGTPATP